MSVISFLLFSGPWFTADRSPPIPVCVSTLEASLPHRLPLILHASRSHFRLSLLRRSQTTLWRKQHRVYKFPFLGGKLNLYPTLAHHLNPPAPTPPLKQPKGFACFSSLHYAARFGRLRPDLWGPDACPMFAQRGSDGGVNNSPITAAKVTTACVYRGSLERDRPFVTGACKTISTQHKHKRHGRSFKSSSRLG